MKTLLLWDVKDINTIQYCLPDVTPTEEEKRKRDEEIARNLKEEQLRKEELQEERRALEKQRDERQKRQEEQLAEQVAEQSRQSPAKSHSNQSDGITPERLEGLEGEELAAKRDLLGPGAQVDTTKATFCTSPAGREMPRLDETVSEVQPTVQPTLRGTLQSFEKEQIRQNDFEKVEPQIWQTTSLWEESGTCVAHEHPYSIHEP